LQVAVVAFHKEAHSATDQGNSILCKERELAAAIPHNKAFMKKYINNLYARPSGHENGTVYTAGLGLAFDYFASSTAISE
jgi:hypothetical protein